VCADSTQELLVLDEAGEKGREGEVTTPAAILSYFYTAPAREALAVLRLVVEAMKERADSPQTVAEGTFKNPSEN
jgi:hypothetical protein